MPGYNPISTDSKDKGYWDATANTPDYEVELTQDGEFLKVIVAGTQTIDTVEIVFSKGDQLVKTSAGYEHIKPTNPEYTGFTDGDFIKIVNGVASPAGFRENGDKMYADKPVQSEQNSLFVGPACKLSEYGGLPSVKSFMTGCQYLPVLHRIVAGDLTPCSEKPFYIEFSNNRDEELQADDSTLMSNVTEILITTLATSNRMNTFTLDFNSAVTGVKAKITNLSVTDEPVIKYFPTKKAWDGRADGIDFLSGKQEVYPAGQDNATKILFAASTSIKIELLADSQIDLKGNGTTPYLKSNVDDIEFVELSDVITLASDDTTQETLDVTGADFTVNQVTTTTDGAMVADDKLKLDNLTCSCNGDSWVSGLLIQENAPKDQTVLYSAGTYLIGSIAKEILTGGIYDLENDYLLADNYSTMIDDQHRLVGIYVDTDEVIKSVAGTIAEKTEVADLPVIPSDSVCLAIMEIKVDKNDNPKDIGNREIQDCRLLGSYGTDEFVSISADDTGVGHLADKLSNLGNVQFSIENPGGYEKIKADVAGVGIPPSITYTTNSHIDGLDVSTLSPHGILFIDTGANRELKSLTGGVDKQMITVVNLDTSNLKIKNNMGIGQKLRVEGNAERTIGDFGGCTLVYSSSKGYWYVVGIIV